MTTVYAQIRTGAVVFDPQVPGVIPDGSLYLDSTNSNVLTTKTVGGSEQPIGTSSSADIMIKEKENKTGVTIAISKRVSIKSDGSICLADNDDPVARQSFGLTLESIDHLATGRILLDGPNAVGAIAGLGFTPGQPIMLSSTPGVLTNDLSSFDPETDVIMKVGIADCAAGVASATASDLIMVTDVISTPSGV